MTFQELPNATSPRNWNEIAEFCENMVDQNMPYGVHQIDRTNLMLAYSKFDSFEDLRNPKEGLLSLPTAKSIDALGRPSAHWGTNFRAEKGSFGTSRSKIGSPVLEYGTAGPNPGAQGPLFWRPLRAPDTRTLKAGVPAGNQGES